MCVCVLVGACVYVSSFIGQHCRQTCYREKTKQNNIDKKRKTGKDNSYIPVFSNDTDGRRQTERLEKPRNEKREMEAEMEKRRQRNAWVEGAEKEEGWMIDRCGNMASDGRCVIIMECRCSCDPY